MPRDVIELDLEEEADQLADRLDTIAERQVDGEIPSQEAAHLAGDVEQQMWALEEALEEYDADATWSVRAFTPGEKAELTGLIRRAKEQADRTGDDVDVEAMLDNYWAGAGLVDAPFLEGGAGLQERIMTVRDEPNPYLVQFIATRVTDENTLKNGKRSSYTERVAAKQSDQSAAPSSGRQS
ncbi:MULTISPECIES: hypothetical protein [Haloferacaceae]|uniref:Uncharacterized protein n=1 Tax=Halorubrum glutamatedens TaxID=2707018 RepID=A0ABD5QU08_9EURY|nr:hypothetical protein [Halobellus captivus]